MLKKVKPGINGSGRIGDMVFGILRKTPGEVKRFVSEAAEDAYREIPGNTDALWFQATSSGIRIPSSWTACPPGSLGYFSADDRRV